MDLGTIFGYNVFMIDKRPLTLHKVDQARVDFASIETELKFINGQLSRFPTRGDLARAALAVIVGTVGLIFFVIEVLGSR
jgi:hypothetical protein